jgi:hypothetical protein
MNQCAVSLCCSNYHVELNPSDVGNNDRYVVQEVIKELAKNRPLDVAGACVGVGGRGQRQISLPLLLVEDDIISDSTTLCCSVSAGEQRAAAAAAAAAAPAGGFAESGSS